MLILLPPSEGKTQRRRGQALALTGLSFPTLTKLRAEVIEALAAVSATPAAPAILGVSPNLTDEIARNTRLTTAPTAPAGEVYSGVLYDALDLASLDAAAKRRATRRIVVQSALFGAVRLTDRIPAYRLSMAVNLPGVGPLASVWRGPVSEEMAVAAGTGVIVDCRSSTYAAVFTPTGPLADRWVQIHVPGATHMAKHTRGLVARALCLAGGSARTPRALAGLLEGTFEVDLARPVRPGRPWVLSALHRG